MAKAKEVAEAPTNAASASTAQQQVKPPEKKAGPAQLFRAQSANSPLPPRIGSPSLARAGELVANRGQVGTPGRARMSGAMQQQVGNARLNRMAMPGMSAPTGLRSGSGASSPPASVRGKSNRPLNSRAPAVATPGKTGGRRPTTKAPIQRKCACGGEAGPDGECAACKAKRLNRQAGTMPPIQRKCACGGEAGPDGECANCKAKREAVQRRPTLPTKSTPTRASTGTAPVIQRKCACGGEAGPDGECAGCKAKRLGKNDQRQGSGDQEVGTSDQRVAIQRQATQASAPSELPASVRGVLQSSDGQPLSRAAREPMEQTFDQDFGGVRVHTGPQVARAARDINAEAFTTGQDIYFGEGRYQPQTPDGKKLLAHELTHTIQQRANQTGLQTDSTISQPGDAAEQEAEAMASHVATQGAIPSKSISPANSGQIQRYSWDEFVSDVSDVGETAARGAEAVGEAAVSGAEAVGEAVVSGAEAAGEAVVSGVQAVGKAAGEAADWLATEAGQLAQQIAAALGVSVRVTSAGLEITVPRICPIDALPFRFELGSLEKDFMVPIFEIPIGPDVFLSGEIGLIGHLTPEVQIQLGPICLNGINILINPVTNNYSISGSLSATAATSLGAEVRGGLKGQLSLMAIIPVGGVPVPISVPLIGLEGGLAGLVRGVGASTLTMGGGWSFSGGVISLSQNRQLDLRLGADFFLGAYGQLDILGLNVCRIYWQPFEWHGDMAASLGISAGLTIAPGGLPSIIPSIDPPTLDQIPFDQFRLAISRRGFSDDCPIKDKLCEILRLLNLLPSQNGGTWNWSGPYGPGKRLPGPLEVYGKNPGIPSGSECRGACGINCDTCKHIPIYHYADPATGKFWEYTNFQDCHSHEGCREHDAAFDWAADKKGEIGKWAIIMPWHMAANIECTCNNLAGNCIAWIAGLPPYDSKMYFADSANEISDEEMIRRFGNRRRNLGLDPDKDPVSPGRLDDAPIFESFRRLYNRLDSWDLFISARNPNLLAEFRSRFNLEKRREQWLDGPNGLKVRTREYKARFRNLENQDVEQMRRDFKEHVLGSIQAEMEDLNREIAVWFRDKTGSTESIEDLIERIHREGTEIWRAAWKQAILQVNRVLSRLWPPAKEQIIIWVGQMRARYPHVDLSGPVGELDYIGSLATGFKGPPKQQIRFDPRKFDVDANLEAPPLAKYAVEIEHQIPDRGRIFGRNTHIDPLNQFSEQTHAELKAHAEGYNADDPFDVAINTPELPTQERQRVATDRVYRLRERLPATRYSEMISELKRENLVVFVQQEGRFEVRSDLTEAQFGRLTEILDRFERGT